MTTRERIDAYVKARGGICMVTHTEIAEAVGVTRERVGQILGRRSTPRSLMLVESFFLAHPEAVLPKMRGGMSFSEIAMRLSLSKGTVEKAYRALGYPARTSEGMMLDATEIRERRHSWYVVNKEHHQETMRHWRQENRERWREIGRKAEKAWRGRKALLASQDGQTASKPPRRASRASGHSTGAVGG